MDLVERYLLLGLRLGRHVDGLVDFAYGRAGELRDEVALEPLAEPVALAAEGDALLADLSSDASLVAGRRAWLVELATGLRAYAGVLAGEAIGYVDEVERCYGVRPEWTPEERFAEAHERLERLLPGAGPLAERLERSREASFVPSAVFEPAVHEVLAVLQERTGRLFGLPAGEAFELALVEGEPWLAFNYYLGGMRSRIAVNVDLPITALELVELLAHEGYPGHHTERAWKEQALVDGDGWAEEAAAFVPTPAATVAEGIATVAPDLVLADDGVRASLERALGDLGVPLDLGASRAVHEARRTLGLVNANAALLLHERGAGRDEVVSYVRRWRLATEARAERSLAFLTDPTWRAYSTTYTDGRRLVDGWVGGDATRFRRLLTEQVTVAELTGATPGA